MTGELREGQFERPKLEHVELRPSVRAACASEERDLSSAARGSRSREQEEGPNEETDGRSSGNFSLQILGHHCRLLRLLARLPARLRRGSLAPVEIKSPSCGTTTMMAMLLVLDATDPQHAVAILWNSCGTP